jgi:hypothetical protein
LSEAILEPAEPGADEQARRKMVPGSGSAVKKGCSTRGIFIDKIFYFY